MTDSLIVCLQRRAADPRTRTDLAKDARRLSFPPVSTTEIEQCERRLGFRIPPTLAEVYRRVGNGGFGPGTGVIGLPGGFTDVDGNSIVERYEIRRLPRSHDSTWAWPDGLVPICDWGCAVSSCIDCHAGSIITFDPNEREVGTPMATAFALSHTTVAAWFEDWVNGVRLWERMYEIDPAGDRMAINPFTRQPIVVHKKRLRR